MLPIPGFIGPRVIDRGQIWAIMMPSGQINPYQQNMNQYNYTSLMHIFFLTVLGFQPNHERWRKASEEAAVRNYGNPCALQWCLCSLKEAPPPARYVLVSCVVHAHTCMKDGDILLDHIWPILWDEISPWTWSSPISFQLGKLAGRPPMSEPSVSTPSSQPWGMRSQSAFFLTWVLKSELRPFIIFEMQARRTLSHVPIPQTRSC